MKNGIIERINQEKETLERLANEKISLMSDEEITNRANKIKRNTVIFCALMGMLFLFGFIVCLFYIIEEDSNKSTLISLCIILALCIIILLIMVLGTIKKSPKALILPSIRQEIRPFVIDQIESSKLQKIDPKFVLSKIINIRQYNFSYVNIFIDNTNKKFIYQKDNTYSKLYNFSDLISYEVYENGKSQVEGTAGTALIGGAFFGLGGLIVGSNVSRDIYEKCNQLKLIIRLNDIQNPQIVITYLEGANCDKSSATYKKIIENLQSVCSMLEYIMNNKTLEQSAKGNTEETTALPSAKEQLRELKAMLDEGLISQEDFELKKKQILNL